MMEKKEQTLEIKQDTLEDVLSILRDACEVEDEIVNFIEYYEEYCSKAYVTVSDMYIKLIWTEGKKQHTCTIYPKTKKVELNSISNGKSKFTTTDDFIEYFYWEFLEWIKNKKDIPVPFKPLKEKKEKKPSKSIVLSKIKTVKIKYNPEIDSGKMLPDIAVNCIKKDEFRMIVVKEGKKESTIHYGWYEKKKKYFASTEDAIIDTLILTLDYLQQGFKIDYLTDDKDRKKRYKITKLEQLVYKYIKTQTPNIGEEIELPVYDPHDNEQANNFINAIESGNIELVKQYIKAGVNPKEFIEKKKTKRHPIASAIQTKHIDIALELVANCKTLGLDVEDEYLTEIKFLSKGNKDLNLDDVDLSIFPVSDNAVEIEEEKYKGKNAVTWKSMQAANSLMAAFFKYHDFGENQEKIEKFKKTIGEYKSAYILIYSNFSIGIHYNKGSRSLNQNIDYIAERNEIEVHQVEVIARSNEYINWSITPSPGFKKYLKQYISTNGKAEWIKVFDKYLF